MPEILDIGWFVLNHHSDNTRNWAAAVSVGVKVAGLGNGYCTSHNNHAARIGKDVYLLNLCTTLTRDGGQQFRYQSE